MEGIVALRAIATEFIIQEIANFLAKKFTELMCKTEFLDQTIFIEYQKP